MKTTGILVGLLVLVSSILGAERIITLEDEYRLPLLLGVEQGRFYIFDKDQASVNEYSLENGSRSNSFCRKGQGPGECRWVTRVTFENERFVVSGGEKVMYFDKKGRYIDEIKAPYAHHTIIPVGDKFVCRVHENGRGKTTSTITVFDTGFTNPRKLEAYINTNIYRAPNGKFDMDIYKDCFGQDVTNQTIVVGNTHKGFHFGIFDKNGNKIRSIDREYEKLEVTEEHKKDYDTRLRNLIGPTRYKHARQRFNPIFPDHYPAYNHFVAHNQKIYVRLYPIVNNTQELLVLDLKGNTLSRHTVPATDTDQKFHIYNSHYCCLKENEDLEQWQLHMHPLK